MTSSLSFNSISSKLREEKNSLGKKSGVINKIPGVGDTADIAAKLREGKIGGVAEAGVGLAVQSFAPGFGTVALKTSKALGIPVNKIIIFAVIGMILFFCLILLAGGYAMTHPFEVLIFS